MSEVFLTSLSSQKTHKWCLILDYSIDVLIFDLYDCKFLQIWDIELWTLVILRCMFVPFLRVSDLLLGQVEKRKLKSISGLRVDLS